MINKDKAELIPGGEYLGLNNYRLSEELQKKYGEKVGIISIGGAGEKGYKNSSLQVTDTNKLPSRSAGREDIFKAFIEVQAKASLSNIIQVFFQGKPVGNCVRCVFNKY